MIVKTIQELPRFETNEMLTIDVETTSFNDDEEAFNPFRGHRIAGVAICTMDQKNSWYVPMRHSEDVGENIPLDAARAWLKNVIESGRDIVNHFIKFDAKMWHFDGCTAKGRLIDTSVMARLWKSDLYSLSLNNLSGGLKDPRVKAYLKSIHSKDFGRVPISIMGPYAQTDAIETAKLYAKYKQGMRVECKQVWDTEIALTSKLVTAEIKGFKVDVVGLKIVYRNLLRQMLDLQKEIDNYAGCEVDCLSSDDLNEVLTNKMGFEIQSYTPKGNPQWNRAALTQLQHPIGERIKEYTHLAYFTSVFCEGWLKRIDENNRLHTNFMQAAAKTGRMTSKDPCTTNLPVEAEMFILPDDDCAILGFDYSQIEYRIFAHYANDEDIINAYQNNPNTDYHQMLADMLGVPRTFSKSLNFSFIYGMGKKTLLQAIAGMIAISQDKEMMANKLRSYGRGVGSQFAKTVKDMNFSDYTAIASGVYNEYHRKVPAIRALTNRVSNAVLSRGWLKNYMGRVYMVPPKASYKAVNLLIQGSAADIFKNRINAVLDELTDMGMITNVYDSMYFNVPKEELKEYYSKAVKILEQSSLRVPLKVMPTVGIKSLGSCVKTPTVKDVDKSIKTSLTYVPDFKRKTIRAASFLTAGNQELGNL